MTAWKENQKPETMNNKIMKKLIEKLEKSADKGGNIHCDEPDSQGRCPGNLDYMKPEANPLRMQTVDVSAMFGREGMEYAMKERKDMAEFIAERRLLDDFVNFRMRKAKERRETNESEPLSIKEIVDTLVQMSNDEPELRPLVTKIAQLVIIHPNYDQFLHIPESDPDYEKIKLLLKEARRRVRAKSEL